LRRFDKKLKSLSICYVTHEVKILGYNCIYLLEQKDSLVCFQENK